MGGFEGLAGEVLEKEAGEGIGKFLSKFEEGQGFYKTARDILSKSETGQVLLKHLDDVIIPQSRKTAQAYFDASLSSVPKTVTGKVRANVVSKLSREAKTKAWGDVRSTYLGKKDEVLIKSIHDATKSHGQNYGNMMADALTYVMHDAGESYKLPGKDVTLPGWRTERVKLAPGEKGISLADVGIREKGKFTSPEAWEQNLRIAAGWMNAPLIAIPHMSQVGATLLDSGFKATAKALADYGKIINGADDIMAGVMRSGVLFDEMHYEMQQEARGAGLVEKLFHFPGFNWVRRQELTLSALAGKHAAIDAVEKLTKDSSDKWAKHTIEKLGIKFDDLAEKGFKLTQSDIETAMFKEANRSIMVTRELDTPWKWQESAMARLSFQYKDFAYRYGRFISSGLWNAAKYGGPTEFAKSLSIYLTVFPAFGEIVHSMENIASAKNPFQRDSKSNEEEYFSALGYAGGLGIFNSLWRAGLYNKGKGFLEGPTASNIEDFTFKPAIRAAKIYKALDEGDTYKAQKEAIGAAQDLTYKLGWPGRMIANQIKNYEKDNK